jgi:hypothetical protein
VIKLADHYFVNHYVASRTKSLVPGREEYLGNRLIVNATVQDRGRSAGLPEKVGKYCSEKHHPYCLNWQVIANRKELAGQTITGVLAVKHDFWLFNENLKRIEDLTDRQRGNPCDIPADKRYIQ